jgi:hypothetical protein
MLNALNQGVPDLQLKHTYLIIIDYPTGSYVLLLWAFAKMINNNIYGAPNGFSTSYSDKPSSINVINSTTLVLSMQMKHTHKSQTYEQRTRIVLMVERPSTPQRNAQGNLNRRDACRSNGPTRYFTRSSSKRAHDRTP